MPTPTYDLIEEQIVSTDVGYVSFSNIPGTYKDIVLEVMARSAYNATSAIMYCYINSSSAADYSRTRLLGTGTNAQSSRDTNQGDCQFGEISGNTAAAGAYGTCFVHFMSYANTNVFKTILCRSNEAGSYVMTQVNLWRKTNAITGFDIFTSGAANIKAGSTFRLWGVSG